MELPIHKSNKLACLATDINFLSMYDSVSSQAFFLWNLEKKSFSSQNIE